MQEWALVQADGSLQGMASEEGARAIRREDLDRLLSASAALAYRVAMSVVRNSSEAEDIAQDALVRAFQKFQHVRDVNRFRGWLVKVTFRLALDRRKSTRRREEREIRWSRPELRPPELSVEEMVASKQFEERLARALEELPKRMRLVVILAAMEGYTMAEVAEILHVSTGTVKSRLFKARKCLAEKLR
jgi:RNA polymerase sigma-70 factor, ECF subfamily